MIYKEISVYCFLLPFKNQSPTDGVSISFRSFRSYLVSTYYLWVWEKASFILINIEIKAAKWSLRLCVYGYEKLQKLSYRKTHQHIISTIWRKRLNSCNATDTTHTFYVMLCVTIFCRAKAPYRWLPLPSQVQLEGKCRRKWECERKKWESAKKWSVKSFWTMLYIKCSATYICQ